MRCPVVYCILVLLCARALIEETVAAEILMPKHLAIVIAGAVSLGSYEAGVLYEVLTALETHNTDKSTKEEDKIYIDVITGASAGGMTAAIAAQRLLYDPQSLRGPQTNVFYEAWVKRISLAALVRMHWKEDIWHSLFSSDLIETIANKMLIDSMTPLQGKKPKGFHPAIEIQRDETGNPILDSEGDPIPKPLWLGMAVTNLNGLTYGYPILQGRGMAFQYTRCVDQITQELPGALGDELPLWTKIRNGAVASGAFPFAFRVQDITRQRDEYQSATIQWPSNPPQAANFTYTDGGVLQNQPIGMAKNLIDQLVLQRLSEGEMNAYNDADSRVYLFVSPHSLESTVSVGFDSESANFKSVLNELMRTYRRQAEFHDWIMAEDLNQQVNLLDERANDLANLLANNSTPAFVGPLRASSVELATRLTGSNNSRLEQVDRLKIQYSTLYNQVLSSGGPGAADAWVNSILTLEAAAQLGARDRMDILGVLAEGRQELAGTGFAAFVGFFSQKFREHDYIVGRNKARQYLQTTEVSILLGHLVGLDSTVVPDDTGISKLPLSSWQALYAGKFAFVYFIFWRLLKLWPWTLAFSALITFGIWEAICHFLRR